MKSIFNKKILKVLDTLIKSILLLLSQNFIKKWLTRSHTNYNYVHIDDKYRLMALIGSGI